MTIQRIDDSIKLLKEKRYFEDCEREEIIEILNDMREHYLSDYRQACDGQVEWRLKSEELGRAL